MKWVFAYFVTFINIVFPLIKCLASNLPPAASHALTQIHIWTSIDCRMELRVWTEWMTTHVSVQVTSQESSVRLLPWWPCCTLRHHPASTMTARTAFVSNQWAPVITSANVHQAIQVCIVFSSEHHRALIILVHNQGLFFLLLLSIGPRWAMPRMYCSHIGLLYYP